MSGAAPAVALSVDLDEAYCYRAIHGLADGAGGEGGPIYDRAVPRLLELFARHSVPATFFAVGRDAAAGLGAVRLREIAGAGHEIGNHTLSHHYDLVRRQGAVIVSEVAAGRAAIEDAIGAAVRGFRAPGYTLTDELVEILADQRVEYDSSVLPSPLYFLARSAAVALKALRGRRSRSLLGGFAMGVAPARPYRVGRPFFLPARGAASGAGSIRELPIAVVPGLRVPFIGTTLVLAGPRRAEWLCRVMERLSFVNLELHGIDACGPEDPGIRDLVGHQPDAGIPLFTKISAIESVILRFRSRGAEFLTLRHSASRFLP